MTTAWTERKFGRSGIVEWKYDVPLRRGQHSPRVVFIPNATGAHTSGNQERAPAEVIATTRFGYPRTFARVEEAKAWIEQREAFFTGEGR